VSKSRFLLIDIGLLALFIANGLRAAVANSGVCDELGAHIPTGYLYWSSGEFSGGLGNFPLGQLLIAAPTYLLGHSYELFTEQHLLLFRLPVLMLGALLGLLVSRMATSLYGRTAGVAALFLYALSPNILAHATLATLDLPTAFVIFLTVYCLYCYVEKPGPARARNCAADESAVHCIDRPGAGCHRPILAARHSGAGFWAFRCVVAVRSDRRVCNDQPRLPPCAGVRVGLASAVL
jgi:hypothetical protein